MNTLMLGEVKGPLHDLNDRLAGPHGKMWLGILNRMLRRKQTWPKIDRPRYIPTLPPPRFSTIDEIRSSLESFNMEVNRMQELKDYDERELHSTYPKSGEPEKKGRHLIQVRLGDLLNEKQMKSFCYSEVLDFALENYGFEPCPIIPGLRYILEETKAIYQGSLKFPIERRSIGYMICSQSLDGKLVYGHISSYRTLGKQDQGTVLLYSVGSVFSRLTVLSSPADVQLIFEIEE